MKGTLHLSRAIDNVAVDVDVDVDLGVDTAGHPLATFVLHCGLGSALGRSGSSCLPSLARVQVHVHDYVHDDVHDHVATCPPDTFTGSEVTNRVQVQVQVGDLGSSRSAILPACRRAFYSPKPEPRLGPVRRPG